MIAKQIKGKDFYGLLKYHEEKVKLGDAYVLDGNIDLGKTVGMTREFNIVRQLRPRLQKAVYHVSLNLPMSDKLNDNDFSCLAEDYLNGMGFDDNQHLVYLHTDQDHQHVHIIANRVKYSGDVVSDSGDYKRSQKLVRLLEKKYKLTQLDEFSKNQKSSLTQKEIEKAIRTGDVPIKVVLQQSVKEALRQATNVDQFIKQLQKNRIKLKFNLSKSTERVMGISFKYNDVIFKGSTLGRKFSWNNIIKQIDYEQGRDRAVILENNSSKPGNEGLIIENGEKAAIDFRKHIDNHQEPKNHLEQVKGNVIELQNSKTKGGLMSSNQILKGGEHSVINTFLQNLNSGGKGSSANTSFFSDNAESEDVDRKKKKKKGRKLF